MTTTTPRAGAPRAVEQTSEGNRVVSLRVIENQRIELELSTPIPFSARDDRLVLDIGDVRSYQARHPDGDLSRVVFTLEAIALASAPGAQRLLVHYASNRLRQWDFGTLDEARAR